MIRRLLRPFRRVPLHVVLVAALPALMLWSTNGADVRSADAVPVLAGLVAGGVAIAATAALAMRDLLRGSLLASMVVASFLIHGQLWGSGDGVARAGLVVTLVVVVVATRAMTRAADADVGLLTACLNLLLSVLVVVALPGVASSVRTASEVRGVPTLGAVPTSAADAPGTLRDIVWIVPDRYGSVAGLEQMFGIDNRSFVAALEARGFVVAEDAMANYPSTAQSLSAQLNMSYLEGLAPSVPRASQDDLQALDARLRDHRVGRTLTDAGYEYVHSGNWWYPTSTATSADVVRRSVWFGEFATALADNSALPSLGLTRMFRDRHRGIADAQFDLLEAEAELITEDPDDAPRFVFAHVTLPHPPYVFDADGSPVSRDTAASRSRSDNFGRQLTYVNGRLLDVVDTLLDVDEDHAPIVLIQADEGPHPDRKLSRDDFRWDEATDDELFTKFSILSAFRLPGVDAGALVRDDISGVNAMRLILDEYLGADLGQLPDRAFVPAAPDRLYTFVDVTERVEDSRAP